MDPTEVGRPGILARPSPPPGEPAVATPSLDDPRVIRALEEYRAALEAGNKPNRHEFQARYADISQALADCLDGLEFIHTAAPQLEEAALAAAAEIQAEAPLGDYRIIREIGRGGMGVVYEAVQISLGRCVALKVLPFASALDAKQLQRFKNEAQAAAHLHHQNIVPVHGVGCARGVHYYAMQFIDGQTLAALIEELRQSAGLQPPEPPSRKAAPSRASALAGELAAGHWAPPKVGRIGNPSHAAGAADDPTSAYAPLTTHRAPPTSSGVAQTAISTDQSTRKPAYFRTVANLGVQAAEALEHAHQQGVVHRDIKPANLMVDLRGNLWITDFGLAHCQSQAGLTMSGDLVGTLRYMSPEQALARLQVDQRTDIYSLGATLYELLTLEPALEGRDRQELLRQIAFEEPRPPRQRNKAIPQELETIVLKAMEKNPAERYASAREVADDLERYLKDEPIRARRPTLVHKIKKWARRHPGVVRTALLSAAILLVTVAVGASLAAWRLNDEQNATREQLRLTEQAQEQATRRLYDARMAQAKAGSLSRRVGQRLDSLDVLAEAAKIARSLNLPEECLLQRRIAAIACLALPDLRLGKPWAACLAGAPHADFDGRMEHYALTNRQGAVSIRRVAGDQEIARLPGSGFETWPIFSRDGKYLAVLSLGSCQVWKLGGHEPVIAVQVPAGDCYGFDFSPDSRQCAIGRADGSISLHDLASGQPPRWLPGGRRATYLAFHPKGRQLAVASSTSVEIRDLDTGKVVHDLKHQAIAYNLAWHPDGKTLAVAGCDSRQIHRIHLWDVPARKQTLVLEGIRNGGVTMAFNHSGDLLASTAWDGILRLWNPRTGKQLFSTMSWHAALRFSLDDRLLAADIRDDKLGLWEVAACREYRTLVRAAAAGIYEITAIRSDGRLLAVAMPDGVGLWDLTSGKEVAFIKLPGCTSVLFEPSGALLTSGSAGLLRWPVQAEPAKPGLLRIGPPHKLSVPGSIGHIACSADGKVIALSQFQGGRVLHADRPDQPVRLEPHDDARYVAVSPDGRWVATGTHAGTGVKIWEARSGGEPVKVLPAYLSRVGFSPDGKWLATWRGGGTGLRLWAVGSWQEGPQIGGGVFAFSPDPDRKLLAVETGHGAVRLVDPDTGREYARLEDPNQDRAFHLSFSPDGTRLVACNHDSQSIHVWDLRRIRQQLAKMDLDWGLLPYPALVGRIANPSYPTARPSPLRVKVDLGDLTQPAPERQEITRQLIEEKRRALKAKPNNALACNELAWLYLTAPEGLRDWKAALPLAQKAMQLDPNVLHRNTLGLAYYRAGRYPEAVKVLEANLKDQADWALTYDLYFLAMCHHQLGDGVRAKQFHDLAVRWSASHKESLAPFLVELTAIHAEAGAVLGLRQRAQAKDKPK